MSLIDYLRQPRNKRERKVASHARRRERERIIALIESSKVGSYQDSEFIVALIKGEK
jgi:hypothetical protein